MSDNKEKTEGMMLEEQLVWKFPHIGKDAPEQVEAAAEFCEGYKALLDEGKTDYLNDRTLYWHFPAYLETGPGLNEARDPLFRSRPVSVILQKGWKLIENYEDGTLELYDLNRDPSEKQDVFGKYPDKTAQLYDRLNAWKKETNAPVPERLNPLYKPESKK